VPWGMGEGGRSMAVGGTGDDRTPWAGAQARARELAGAGARLLVLGDPPQALGGPADLDALAGAPAGRGSALVPALRQAAEAG